MKEDKKISLPYIDNAKAVIITIVINLGVVFLFFWPDGVNYSGALLDSLICAVITTAINMSIVCIGLKKLRTQGQMPVNVPISPFMQKLPKNPVALGLIYAAAFGALTVLVNGGILWFFDLKNMTFVPWMTYKLIYTTVLSVKIVDFCIFRYVQPDCANAGQEKEYTGKPVKDPTPKVGVFKEMFGSVTMNIALNLIFGSALGGVIVTPESAVVIYPTTVEGIPITGLIFGFIVGVLVTRGVTKSIDAAILSNTSAEVELPPPDKRFTWLPKRKVSLTCLVCACAMIFSAVALWGIMTLFEIGIMNFFQFVIFISVYAGIVSKPIAYTLVRRCTQPDYITYKLKKG